jgi:hypothetical protein
MSPKPQPGPETKASGAEDQKMSRIADEVDRFFQSVHADIEDWKFSMEDYGDGTRIFVRFQIHINKAGDPPTPQNSRALGTGRREDTKRLPEKPIITVKSSTPVVERTEPLAGPDETGDRERAELDLASFVDLWRRKRQTNQSGEFHKEGAPFMETQAEWDGQKRKRSESSQYHPRGATDEKPKVSPPGK